MGFSTVSFAKSPKKIFHLYASKEIKGRIVDEKGGPLSDVSVLVKGTTVGVNTGADGSFTLTVPEGKMYL